MASRGSKPPCGIAARWLETGRFECRLPVSPPVHPAIAANFRSPPFVSNAALAKVGPPTVGKGLGAVLGRVRSAPSSPHRALPPKHDNTQGLAPKVPDLSTGRSRWTNLLSKSQKNAYDEGSLPHRSPSGSPIEKGAVICPVHCRSGRPRPTTPMIGPTTGSDLKPNIRGLVAHPGWCHIPMCRMWKT